jgi:hypothetical protein
MNTATDDDTLYADLRACLGEDVELYAIIARGKFALRYGPMSFEQAEYLIEMGERECFPVMITANCGRANLFEPDAKWPSLDTTNTIASLFGATLEERQALKAKTKEPFDQIIDALHLTGDVVAHMLMGGRRSLGSDKRRLEVMREVFKPIGVMAEGRASVFERFNGASDEDGARRETPRATGAILYDPDAITRLLSTRQILMDALGSPIGRDKDRIDQISEIDAELDQRGYTGALAKPAANLRDDNCELPKTLEPSSHV